MWFLSCPGALDVPAHWRPWASKHVCDALPRTHPGAVPQDPSCAENDPCSHAVSGQQSGTGAIAKVSGSSHGSKVVLPFLILPLPGWQKATLPAMPCPTGSTDACLAARTPRQPCPRRVPCTQQRRVGSVPHPRAAWAQAPFSKHPSRRAPVVPPRLTHVRPAHPPLLTVGKVGAMSLH